MPEKKPHRLVSLIAEDQRQWPDLQHKIAVGAVEGTSDVSLALLGRHMQAEVVVVVRLDLPDGRVVVGEVPFDAFWQAAVGMKAATQKS